MVYLDYSATTKTDEEILETYNKVSTQYYANTNSNHAFGIKSKLLLNASLKQIAEYIGCSPEEIIITSGASEANNLALKGIISAYPKRNKTILTTKIEHSSIKDQTNINFKYLKLQKNGLVNLNHLEELLKEEPVLVSIVAVDSDLGIRQEIEEIAKIIKNYPKTKFHVDATQAIGKVQINYENVDLISFSGHKIYGPKGVGALIAKNNTLLYPQIEGGESITKFRSGTPPLELTVSLAKALKKAITNQEENYQKVEQLSKYLVSSLPRLSSIKRNNTSKSIPHIVNLSIDNIQGETFVNALSEDNIYISTKSACSNNLQYSQSVKEITNNEQRAKSAIRISISHQTTKEEIDLLVKSISKNIPKLSLGRDYE